MKTTRTTWSAVLLGSALLSIACLATAWTNHATSHPPFPALWLALAAVGLCAVWRLITVGGAVVILALVMLIPNLAYAGPPFAAVGSTLKADLLTLLTPFAAIACLAIGVCAIFNIIHKAWLIGLLFGIGLLYGNDQVIAWFRSLMGV